MIFELPNIPDWCILRQSRNIGARENFLMRFLQLKISPPQGHRSVETELYYSLVTQGPGRIF